MHISYLTLQSNPVLSVWHSHCGRFDFDSLLEPGPALSAGAAPENGQPGPSSPGRDGDGDRTLPSRGVLERQPDSRQRGGGAGEGPAGFLQAMPCGRWRWVSLCVLGRGLGRSKLILKQAVGWPSPRAACPPPAGGPGRSSVGATWMLYNLDGCKGFGH